MNKQDNSNNTQNSIKIPNEIERKRISKMGKYRNNVASIAILGLILALGIATHEITQIFSLNWPGTSLGFDLDIFTVILALHYTNVFGAIFIAFGKEIIGSALFGENIIFILAFWLIHYFLHIFLSQQRLFKKIILGKKHLEHDCIENHEKCAFATDIIVTIIAGIVSAIVLTLFCQLFILNWYNDLGLINTRLNSVQIWSIIFPFFLALYVVPGFIGSIIYRTVKYLRN